MKSKQMKIMLLCVGALFGSIFLYKFILGLIIKHSMSNQTNITSVSAMTVRYSKWEQLVSATASLRAIRGVNVTTQLAGMVQTIYFKPGAMAQKNELLVQLNADNDIALLNSLKANAELAKITYLRDKAQYTIRAVSKQILDNDRANMKSLQAQVAQQAAIVDQKAIRAPFSGRLGINHVNPGQYVNPGDPVVTLQTLDPIYADFYIPQQSLAKLKVGQDVLLATDAFPKKTFEGKITTIEPAVDVATRNVAVEATIANSKNRLLPGMFGTIDITVGQSEVYLTVPQTAIQFNPFGDVVFILRKSKAPKNGESVLIARQRFVTTGHTRGDQIQIIQGLKAGDEIVTSGQMKLRNNSQVVINNKVTPTDNPTPKLKNNH